MVRQIALVATHAPTDDVRTLVGELEAELQANYPPEQRHGLSLDAIFRPHIRFFVASLDGTPAGCGGVAMFERFGELKRMFVRGRFRGQGVAPALLAGLEAATRAAGLSVLRLETGTLQHAAMRFYAREGFVPCGPFGDYAGMASGQIAGSVFMEKRLATPEREFRA